MTQALILSGAGAYADPWHPFAATSARIGDVLEGAGHDVDVSIDVAQRLTNLDGVDILVINAAAGQPSDVDAQARTGVLNFLDRGGGVLAIHVGACRLLRIPEWIQVTGARWVDGVSMHPPGGPCHVDVADVRDPIVDAVAGFDLVDERYCDLELDSGVTALVSHVHDGRTHPLVWSRTHGSARIVVDLLGHDERSYDAPEHRRIIANAAEWLARA